ncbi:ABC transporter like protein [Zymoseptoria brevis]|uniref:ABC transporter like protein n=1 Tax=Zymoseptoria brevis TaxID=1047168 RepID=A0A0F4GTE1_9PEZI|nr:ABC transporter like protein [Zymoseptoria brevis]
MATGGSASTPIVGDYNPERVEQLFDIPRPEQGNLYVEAETAVRTPSGAQESQLSGSTPGINTADHADDSYLTANGREAAESISDEKKSSGFNSDDDQPINAEERNILRRLATNSRRSMNHTNEDPEALERTGTLDGLGMDDPVFDPNSPQFDLYKWLKFTLKLANDEDIKIKRSGLAFKDLHVSGSGSALNLQPTVSSMLSAPLRIGEIFSMAKKPHKQILRSFDGLMKSGELLIVLGRPGSGCSTLLKSLTGQMHGLTMDEKTTIHYNGIDQKQMIKEFQGEVIYNQEVDKHFPHLTVGQTLEHAAALRMSQQRPLGTSRQSAVEYMTQVVMAVYGLSHTYNTKVGNDFVRGVSGGERKRVSIAEMALAGSALAAWDNSTRGLDSATALTFIKALRLNADLVGSAHAVAIYQASQAIYDLFDKAIVLYEGREIFFGKASVAKKYFEDMGFYCPSRQTTGDFLTSVTNPAERQLREGYEDRAPRTADDFEKYWHDSPEYQTLQKEIQAYEEEYPVGNSSELEAFRSFKNDNQAKHARPKSPYVVSVPMQIKLNTKRSWQRIWGDKAQTFTPMIFNVIIALIIGSIFFNSPPATSAFTARGAVLFFAILINALSAISEINSLYDQRPIVEKHKSYAFYHPATEAIAGIVMDVPLKFVVAVCFNLVLYFMSGLRREPAQFFLFFLIAFVSTFVMSAVFRTLAALTKTISQAMALSGVMVLALVIYTGFVVPTKYMKPWFGWIRWINPIFYAFEILVANEFHAREFECSQFIPTNTQFGGETFICSVVGAVAGELTVNGDAYIAEMYGYYYSHVWRNFGILLAFFFAFMVIYFVAVELNSSTSSTAEVLVFRRGHVPAYMQNIDKPGKEDGEAAAAEKGPEKGDEGGDVSAIPPQTDIFTWRDVDYDIEIKGEPRRLLDHVSGWVKPGTLTALMGTSGAGKTTLLDVLAQRTTMGVVTGNMFVNGAPLDDSFQRKTGYVQQQDLHLETSTVRESLRFSAMLRQPRTVSKQEKYEYVEEVIKMLNMEDFAEAVVGVPGEGLNVEQRKLLTIGVELAAKPKLLLFLDEPTSGLDSQSAWAICAFLRKLADAGQAVLCTIHQPSAILFQEFDRLLFLRKGGHTVYFGDIGKNSRTLLDYFESNGARNCGEEENPAEYMLEIVGDESSDWVGTWNDSKEAGEVQEEIERIHKERSSAVENSNDDNDDPYAHAEFAMPFGAQLKMVTHRVFQQYWRMPSYLFAKMALSIAAGLFIGFSFYAADATLQGMQNVIYSLFMLTTIFSTLVQQIQPLFVTQRSLYEVRERPSKAYSWKAFLIANMVVEIPYQIIAGILVYATFYYPVVGIQSSERQVLVMLLCIVLFVYASTFAHMCIAAMPDAQTAGAIVTFLFFMALIFNGVMQPPSALPGFWIFMYRVSPFTYWVASMASAMLHDRQVTCSDTEISTFQPPQGQTCGQYMQPYLEGGATGYLQNPDATADCGYCSIRVADTFLSGVGISWSNRWRDFGLVWVYVFFNLGMAVFLYWFFRVRSHSKKTSKKSKKGGDKKGAAAAAGTEKDDKVVKKTDTSSSEGNTPTAASADPEKDAEAQRSGSTTSKQAVKRQTSLTAGLTRTVSEMGQSVLTTNKGRSRANERNAHVY